MIISEKYANEARMIDVKKPPIAPAAANAYGNERIPPPKTELMMLNVAPTEPSPPLFLVLLISPVFSSRGTANFGMDPY